MHHPNLWRLSTLLAIALAPPDLFAQTNNVSLLASNDTTLYEDATGTLANGAGPSFFVGRNGANGGGRVRRGLLRFDLGASIPPGAKILSARLQLFVAQSSGTQPVAVDAHRVLQAWSEGPVIAPGNGGMGGIATAGESTWLDSDYQVTPWTLPGGDFWPLPSYSFALPASGTVTTTAQPGLVADVQDMLDNPSTNHGWLLKTDELQTGTARRIESREGGLFPPQLLIAWVAAGNTGTFGIGTLTTTGNCAVGIQGPATGGTVRTATYAFLPPSSLGANFFSLAVDPIGISLGPTTRVYLPASPLVPGPVFATDAAGAATTGIPLPANFPGLMLTMQAAVLDQSPLGFALTNAAVMVLQ